MFNGHFVETKSNSSQQSNSIASALSVDAHPIRSSSGSYLLGNTDLADAYLTGQGYAVAFLRSTALVYPSRRRAIFHRPASADMRRKSGFPRRRKSALTGRR